MYVRMHGVFAEDFAGGACRHRLLASSAHPYYLLSFEECCAAVGYDLITVFSALSQYDSQ